MPFWKVIKIHWDEREPPCLALTAAPNGAVGQSLNFRGYCAL
jgi:hypothetical protein